jgi:cytochrome c peroxidase
MPSHLSSRRLTHTFLACSMLSTFSIACSLPVDSASETSSVSAESALVPDPSDPPAPPSLKTVKVPEPSGIGAYVADKSAAIILGKALFWDMQIGSDGVQACASCHFHAGADNRSKNQVSPGLNRVNPDLSANPDKTVQTGGMNYQLAKADFPFRKLENPDDRDSKVLSDTNDIVSSQGVTQTTFIDAVAGKSRDEAKSTPDKDGFQVAGVNVRRVEPRQTPSVINAVFNHRNFWDGRARNAFNGVNGLGERDENARVFRASSNGLPVPVKVLLENSSLASQAVLPPTSSTEMSASGRSLAEIGDKLSAPSRRDSHGGCRGEGRGVGLLPLRPLGKQMVSRDDGVLGDMSRAPRRGLDVESYEELIARAFRSEWWRSSGVIEVSENGETTVLSRASKKKGTRVYSLMEYNFSLFFGLAIQAYESTLVSDDTPFDRFREGDTKALTAQQQRGLDLFRSQSRGRCINCHGGAELTDASVSKVSKNPIRRREFNIIDRGFNNIGVRPTLEDLGLGANDTSPLGLPLSNARLASKGLFIDPTLSPAVQPTDVVGVDGAMKIPGLRNVELTAPYFHNGGARTLREVLDFYSRGGDFRPIKNADDTEIAPLSTPKFTEEEKDALEAFLLSLTDDRVRFERAPFDHPQLFVVDGHIGNTKWVVGVKGGAALDWFREIEAVGKNGGKAPPNFLE